MSHTRSSLKNALSNQIRRLDRRIETLDALSKRLSNIRLLAFMAGVALIWWIGTTGNTALFWTVTALFLGGFSVLVVRHRRIDESAEKARNWREIRHRHRMRIDLQWEEIPFRHSPHDDHPFAHDLNLVGEHSLIHLADTAIYEGGRHRLRDWLLERRPDIDRLTERNRLVQELRPMAHFRDRLTLHARMVRQQREETDWTMKRLLAYLGERKNVNFIPALLLLGTLSAANIVLCILWVAGITAPWVIFTFVAYLLAYNFHSGKVAGLFEESYQMEKLLTRFRALLIYLEQFPYKGDSALARFCSPFRSAGDRPSRYLKKIIGLATAGAAQANQILWVLLNMVVPWDLWFSWKLEQYKNDLKPHLERWLDRFYDLEALSSLANLAWLNPEFTFTVPSTPGTKPPFRAEGIGHPLIPHDQKVRNDITIGSRGEILLITGSNMAGKSTFLRTLGINLALCFAGGPVDAHSLQTVPFRLFSSINVNDSLDQGLSHFYAEVKRLRELLDHLNAPDAHPLFFMVDEIYRGTNNRERMQGSTAFLKSVADRNGIGLVTTHDLELAQLEEEIPSLGNWHFQETIEFGKMHFEYKLQPGPCPTTNALKIMEMEGLPT